MPITLEALVKKHQKVVSSMDVAAPVDLRYLFRSGLIELPSINEQKKEVEGTAGVFVSGSVAVQELALTGHALFIEGDVTAKRVVLNGTMVVLGDLTAEGRESPSRSPSWAKPPSAWR